MWFLNRIPVMPLCVITDLVLLYFYQVLSVWKTNVAFIVVDLATFPEAQLGLKHSVLRLTRDLLFKSLLSVWYYGSITVKCVCIRNQLHTMLVTP